MNEVFRKYFRSWQHTIAFDSTYGHGSNLTRTNVAGVEVFGMLERSDKRYDFCAVVASEVSTKSTGYSRVP